MYIIDLFSDTEIPTGVIDGSNKDFTIDYVPDPQASLEVFLDDVFQVLDVDYTIDQKIITFVAAPTAGKIVYVNYRHIDTEALYETLANWSEVVDDDGKKPEDNADVTGDHEGDINGSNIVNGENWTDDTSADAAQATADGKIVTFIQDEEPTADGVGDLWIDSNDKNKLYRWSGSAWIVVSNTDIAQAILDASNAQTTADSKTDDTAADAAQATADGKITTFYQTAAPTAEGVGDFWIDTDNDNKPYRWSGSAWVAVDNPVADWSKIVDDDSNKPDNNADVTGDHEGDINGSNIVNGENWTDDTSADAAQATADGKIVTFIQDAEPTADGVGDLWIDSNDKNKLYRWSGSAWIAVSNTDIAQAILDASNAQTTADSKTDDTAADAAQATADGKITTFYQTTAPTAEGVGDFWIDTDNDNKPYRWSGSAWVAVDNPVADWSKIVDDDTNKPADNATENNGNLADLDTVDTPEIDDGAVLLEKLSNTKRILMSCFESLDGWSSAGTITQDFGNINIRTTNVANNKAVLWAVPSNWSGLDWSKDFFWQTSVKLAQITNQEIYFGMGATDYVGALSAVGFKIVNNTLYCFHAQESAGSLVYTTQTITGITLNSWNVYRFIHDQSAGTIKFYVNGVLKHTFSSSLPTSSDDSLASFQIETKETAIKYLYVSDLLISVDR